MSHIMLIDDNAKDIPRTPVPSIVPYCKLFGATRNLCTWNVHPFPRNLEICCLEMKQISFQGLCNIIPIPQALHPI